jgi:hypothetical protein
VKPSRNERPNRVAPAERRRDAGRRLPRH